MTIDRGPTHTGPFRLGDRVLAMHGIGLIRPRVPRGMPGVVAGFSPAGEIEVQFANGRVELVRPADLASAA